VFAGVNSNSNGVGIVDTGLILVVEWLPRRFARFPFDENVDAALHTILVTRFDILVIEDTSEFPDTIPCVLGLNVVDDVIVRNNFFVLVIDKAFELDTFWLLLEIICCEVAS